jgi:hypothetical protein
MMDHTDAYVREAERELRKAAWYWGATQPAGDDLTHEERSKAVDSAVRAALDAVAVALDPTVEYGRFPK